MAKSSRLTLCSFCGKSQAEARKISAGDLVVYFDDVLAHAVIDGHQNRSRGGRPEDTMSGILLYDAEGVERSGYATVDRGYSNVLLTLDDKHRQHAMFIAEPTGATTLRLFNADTNDRVDVAIARVDRHLGAVARMAHAPPRS